MDYAKKSKIRQIVGISIWPLVLIVTIGGLKYPLLGLFAPVVMLMALIGGFFNGRFVCGWLCPRGAFFDRVMGQLSPKRKIPSWLRSYKFRWAVFMLLMGFMTFQIWTDPLNIYHWGAVFVRICIITTATGVILAIIYHPRTWCSFCPMGTWQSAVGGNKTALFMDKGCRECRTCEAACPIGLKIVGNIKDGILNSKDCLKCPECQLVCPNKILELKSNS